MMAQPGNCELSTDPSEIHSESSQTGRGWAMESPVSHSDERECNGALVNVSLIPHPICFGLDHFTHWDARKPLRGFGEQLQTRME